MKSNFELLKFQKIPLYDRYFIYDGLIQKRNTISEKGGSHQ